MEHFADYGGDVVADVVAFVRERCAVALDAGVAADRLIVDPGPDFAKSPAESVATLRAIDALRRARASVAGRGLAQVLPGRDHGPAAGRAAGGNPCGRWLRGRSRRGDRARARRGRDGGLPRGARGAARWRRGPGLRRRRRRAEVDPRVAVVLTSARGLGVTRPVSPLRSAVLESRRLAAWQREPGAHRHRRTRRTNMSVITRSALEASPLADLHAIASELGVDGFRRLRKADLVDKIIAQQGGEDAVARPRPRPARTPPRRSRSAPARAVAAAAARAARTPTRTAHRRGRGRRRGRRRRRDRGRGRRGGHRGGGRGAEAEVEIEAEADEAERGREAAPPLARWPWPWARPGSRPRRGRGRGSTAAARPATAAATARTRRRGHRRAAAQRVGLRPPHAARAVRRRRVRVGRPGAPLRARER